MPDIAAMQLSANRTMAAYFLAVHHGDIVQAKAVLDMCITTPLELTLFIEALSGFALSCMHTAQALGSMAGVEFNGDALLTDLTNRLAMASNMDEALSTDDS